MSSCILAFLVWNRLQKKKPSPPSPALGPKQESGPEKGPKQESGPKEVVLPDLKPFDTSAGHDSVIEALLAGRAVGTGTSKVTRPMGAGKVSHATLADVEKSMEAAFRFSDENYFKDVTIRTLPAFVKTCENSPWQCANDFAEGTPVWHWPVAETDPEETSFMRAIKARVEACATSTDVRSCIQKNRAYAIDLDNYGPPRIQRALGKLLAFFRDMRREANTYRSEDPEEEGIRTTFLKPAFETMPVSLYSELKRRFSHCGKGAYGCAGYDGVFLPVFDDPERDLYVFLHELGHVLSGYARSVRVRPVTYCHEDRTHDSFWHLCVRFLSKMAKRVLARRGFTDYGQIMRPWEGYHACFDRPDLVRDV